MGTRQRQLEFLDIIKLSSEQQGHDTVNTTISSGRFV